MGREQRKSQATEGDVGRLKVAVTAPEAAAGGCERGHRPSQQHAESCDSGQPVERRGEEDRKVSQNVADLGGEAPLPPGGSQCDVRLA